MSGLLHDSYLALLALAYHFGHQHHAMTCNSAERSQHQFITAADLSADSRLIAASLRSRHVLCTYFLGHKGSHLIAQSVHIKGQW